MLEFLVENPPVARAVSAWLKASKKESLPKIMSAVMPATAQVRYITRISFAESRILGTRLSVRPSA